MYYELIIIPIIIALLAQAIKLITDGIPNNFRFNNMINDYGGMPSSHTAYVTSLATIIGLSQGFNSAIFAVAFVLMIIVIRDAFGFRREIGRNAIFTNALAMKIFGSKTSLLNERVGHNFLEILMGFILGAAGSVVLYALFLMI